MSLFSHCSSKIQECITSSPELSEDNIQNQKKTIRRYQSKKYLKTIQQDSDKKKQSLKRRKVEKKKFQCFPPPENNQLKKIMSVPMFSTSLPQAKIQNKIINFPPIIPCMTFKPPVAKKVMFSKPCPRKNQIKFSYSTKNNAEKAVEEQEKQSECRYARQQEISNIKQSTSPSQLQNPSCKDSQLRTNIQVSLIEERFDKGEDKVFYNPEEASSKLLNFKYNITQFHTDARQKSFQDDEFPKDESSELKGEKQIDQEKEKKELDQEDQIVEDDSFKDDSYVKKSAHEKNQEIEDKEDEQKQQEKMMGAILKDMELAQSIPDEESSEDSYSEVIERSFNQVSEANMSPENSKVAFMSLREKQKDFQLFNFMSLGNDRFSLQRKSQIQ